MPGHRTYAGTGVDRVVAAALDQLDESGLDGLTMRRVAGRLGVRLNTVYWHAEGKPALLDLMADALLTGCARDPLPTPWPDRLRTLSGRLRDALACRRDGARLVGNALPTGPHGRALTDALARTFTAAGLDDDTATTATRLTLHAVTGLVRDAGSAGVADDGRLAFVLDVLVDGVAAHPRVRATRAARADDDLTRRLRPPPPATRRRQPAGPPTGEYDGPS